MLAIVLPAYPQIEYFKNYQEEGEMAEEKAARNGGKGIIEHDLATGAHTFHPIPPLCQWVDLPPLSGAGLSPASLDEAIRGALDDCEGGIEDKIEEMLR